jgi:hypothetical protein
MPSGVTDTATDEQPVLHGLLPLWPFTTLAEASAWQQAFRAGGQQPWHLDVERTALSFASGYLGYREVVLVTSRTVTGDDALVGVGWKDPNGRPSTVGTLHLVRWGSGEDRPWVVVGSQDSLLTLTTPAYAATVASPLVVGGLITGVDESLHVMVLRPGATGPIAQVQGLGAGGERTPWHTTLTFAARSGTVLTVAVSTGGHVMSVERFAVTGVRVR